MRILENEKCVALSNSKLVGIFSAAYDSGEILFVHRVRVSGGGCSC